MELVVPARVPEPQLRGGARAWPWRCSASSAARAWRASTSSWRTEASAVLVNELNTMPGFTATSVYAKLFEASGRALRGAARPAARARRSSATSESGATASSDRATSSACRPQLPDRRPCRPSGSAGDPDEVVAEAAARAASSRMTCSLALHLVAWLTLVQPSIAPGTRFGGVDRRLEAGRGGDQAERAAPATGSPGVHVQADAGLVRRPRSRRRRSRCPSPWCGCRRSAFRAGSGDSSVVALGVVVAGGAAAPSSHRARARAARRRSASRPAPFSVRVAK